MYTARIWIGLILLFDILLSIGIFFTFDRIVVLSVMLLAFGATVLIFIIMMFHLHDYKRMYIEFALFLELHHDTPLKDVGRGLEDIPPQEMKLSDIEGLKHIQKKRDNSY